jgi:hypothetical protein
VLIDNNTMLLSTLCFGLLGLSYGSNLAGGSPTTSDRSSYGGIDEADLSGAVGPVIEVETVESFINDPHNVKHRFLRMIQMEEIDEAEKLAGEFPYLVDQFNRDIFKELLNSFEKEYADKQVRTKFFELLTPSFLDVSASTTTPLIQSITRPNKEVFTALIQIPGIEAIANKVDNFRRTALMYACNSGDFYLVKQLIGMSRESINFKDDFEKTALHYTCEMAGDATDPEYVDTKLYIAKMLIGNGATVSIDGPEYKISSLDTELADLISSKRGELVVVEPLAIKMKKITIASLAVLFVRVFGLSQSIAYVESALFGLLFNNPLMLGLNEMCFAFQHLILPQYDLNVNISIDSGDAIRDISLNWFFIIFLGYMFRTFVEVSPPKARTFF